MTVPTPLARHRRSFLIAGAATLGAIACGPTEPETQPPTSVATAAPQSTAMPVHTGGIFKVGTLATPLGIDPAISTNAEAYIVTENVYDKLVYQNPQLQNEPQLATTWSSNDDTTEWTFKLRSGVKFHHGKEFAADDVVFTFERLLDPDTKSYLRQVLNPIEEVIAVNPSTVRFKLKAPYADFPALMTPQATAIVASDQSDEQIQAHPSGTGPFKFKELIADERTVLVRNPDYWRQGAPKLDEVHFLVMPEQAARAAALEGGAIHFMFRPSFQVVPQLEANPNTVVDIVESGSFNDMVMNTELEPFTDNRVRQAFKLIADRDAIHKAVISGLGGLGNDDPIAPVAPMNNAALPQRKQDIAEAKRLLAQAGHANGLQLTLNTHGARPEHVAFALTFQEQAKQAGVELEIQKHEDNVYWSNIWMKAPLATSNWSWRTNVDQLCSVMLHSEAKWNESHYKNPEIDQLIAQGRSEPDEQRRKAVYGRIQELVYNEAGLLIPIHKPAVYARLKTVQSYEPHPIGLWLDLRNVSLAQ